MIEERNECINLKREEYSKINPKPTPSWMKFVKVANKSPKDMIRSLCKEFSNLLDMECVYRIAHSEKALEYDKAVEEWELFFKNWIN